MQIIITKALLTYFQILDDAQTVEFCFAFSQFVVLQYFITVKYIGRDIRFDFSL
jgi:hypothetical protein